MRVVVFFVVLVGLGACTRPNPNVCCVTQAQCDELGADELRPCETGQACQANTCIAAQCETSSECTSPDAPICSFSLCVGSCTNDDDCQDVAGRTHCSPESTCVGCTDADQCPASAAICDAAARACRGCERDAECESGVCIEADGVCAPMAAIVWVAGTGSDSGECNQSSPCETVAFAMQRVSTSRNIIRLVGSSVRDSSTIAVDRTVILDGSSTKFYRPATGPIFRVTNGYATFEGIAFEGVSPFDDVAVDGGAGTSVRIVKSAIDRVAVHTNGGALEVRSTSFRQGQIVCSGGTVTLTESDWWRSSVRTTNCQSTIARTRFDGAGDQTLSITGGVLRVLNNVFLVSSEFVDLVYVGAVATGSVFAFNTIVNGSSVTMSPVALYCDVPTLKVSSNIIAYNSTNPISGCAVTNSLFDLPSGSDAAGNVAADVSTFFVDTLGGDYRLASVSPARGIAETGIVSEDFAGLPRPSPVGSVPDAGAHEAP